ncbi:hypothetical protein GCM10010191_65330 [Actinomadura vinacea]|uniref:DoxX family protein n=1 Tax=Actinomadura vinacea TaxID=115336 RepID=A0ABN3JXI7_9ACTN
MTVAYVVITALTILVNAAVAVADLAGARFVRANAAAVNLPESWIPVLGLLKGAGAAGLLFGLAGVRFLGIAAALGLVLFFLGAIAVHVRTRVFHNIAFPGGCFALASASLAVAVAQ